MEGLVLGTKEVGLPVGWLFLKTLEPVGLLESWTETQKGMVVSNRGYPLVRNQRLSSAHFLFGLLLALLYCLMRSDKEGRRG